MLARRNPGAHLCDVGALKRDRLTVEGRPPARMPDLPDHGEAPRLILGLEQVVVTLAFDEPKRRVFTHVQLNGGRIGTLDDRGLV